MNISVVNKKVLSCIRKGELRGYFSEDEISHYDMFTGPRKEDWLCGRLALKAAFLRHRGRTSMPFARITVRNLPTGQPYIEGQQKLFCSLSHSYAWGVGVVAPFPVGVDIEWIRPHQEHFLSYIASEKEIREVREQFPNTAHTATVLWTVKEAVLKALGIGLVVNLKDLQIYRRPPDSFRVKLKPSTGTAVSPWEVFVSRVGGAYVAFACREKEVTKPVVYRWQPALA